MPQFLHRLRGNVEINGITYAIAGATATSGPEVLVATAQIQLDPRATTPFLKDEVVLYAATNTAPVPIFVGEVGPVGLSYFPQSGQITCVGRLDRARVALGIPAGEPLEDIDGNAIPASSLGLASEGGIAITDGEAVMAYLDLVGVPYDADSWEEAGWSMGEVLPLTIMRGQDVLGAIQAIDRVTHCITYDGRDGRARRVRIALPVAVPNLVYQQGANIESIARQIGDRKIVNRLNITGVASDVFTVSDTVEAPPPDSPTTGLPLVPDPPGYHAEDFQSDLIETAEQLLEFGTTELGQRNRPEEGFTLTLPVINPTLSGGESVQIFAPAVGLGVSQVGRIFRASHRLQADSFKTDLSVRMSYAGMGVGTNVQPVASFVYKVLRKRVASGETLWVIACDASGSADPDGAYEIPPHINEVDQEVPGVSHNGIALYQWASSFGAPVSVSDGGKRCTFVTTDNPQGETITLTVFDFQGASASVTQTIAFNEQRRFLVRDLWAAIEQDLLFTADGEITWERVGIPAVGCARFAADTFQIAWESDGTAYKVLTDLSYVEIAGVGPVSAAWITWVYPQTDVPGLRCWLGCQDGSIYFSGDHGDTWEHKATLAEGGAITSIQESAFAENQCYATSGNKLFQTFDGVAWTEIYAHPNPQLIAAGFESGFDVGLAVFHGEPPEEEPGAEATRIRERFNVIQGDWVRAEELFDLPAGTWRVAYSYKAAGGETALSPHQDVVIAGTGNVARIAPLDPLPPGAIGVYYYASLVAGGTILRRFAEDSGFLAVDLDAPAPVGGQLPPTENTTLQNVVDPTAAPVVVTAAAASEAPIDFPADPQALTIGLTVPVVHVAGRSQDDTFQIWSAPIDADFTLQRATYDQDFGLPKDIVRDGAFEDVVFGAAENCIFQTVDGFRSTIYVTLGLLGAEHGLKIGMGALHAIFARGNVVWVACTGINGEGNPVAPITVNALTENGFERLSVHPCEDHASDSSTFPLLNVGGGVLVTYSQARNDGVILTSPGGGPVNAYRSLDGGATWEAIDPQWVSWLATDGQGAIYAICWASATTQVGGTLQRSLDSGATWETMNTFPIGAMGGHSGPIASGIAVSPIDPDTVYLRKNAVWISTDGGATFTNVHQADETSGFGAGWRLTSFTPSGAAVVYVQAHAVGAQRTLIADGTTAAPDPFTDVIMLDVPVLANGNIYAGDTISDGNGVWQSLDDGVTWTQIFGTDQYPVDHNVADGNFIPDFLPGNAANGWYVFLGGIMLQAPPGATPPTAPYTLMLPALQLAFPDFSYLCVTEGAVSLADEEEEG